MFKNFNCVFDTYSEPLITDGKNNFDVCFGPLTVFETGGIQVKSHRDYLIFYGNWEIEDFERELTKSKIVQKFLENWEEKDISRVKMENYVFGHYTKQFYLSKDFQKYKNKFDREKFFEMFEKAEKVCNIVGGKITGDFLLAYENIENPNVEKFMPSYVDIYIGNRQIKLPRGFGFSGSLDGVDFYSFEDVTFCFHKKEMQMFDFAEGVCNIGCETNKKGDYYFTINGQKLERNFDNVLRLRQFGYKFNIPPLDHLTN